MGGSSLANFELSGAKIKRYWHVVRTCVRACTFFQARWNFWDETSASYLAQRRILGHLSWVLVLPTLLLSNNNFVEYEYSKIASIGEIRALGLGWSKQKQERAAKLAGKFRCQQTLRQAAARGLQQLQ